MDINHKQLDLSEQYISVDISVYSLNVSEFAIFKRLVITVKGLEHEFTELLFHLGKIEVINFTVKFIVKYAKNIIRYVTTLY